MPHSPAEASRPKTGTHLRAYSDSAFKKEEQTGHCMRGAVYLICPGNSESAYKASAVCHVLDVVSKQQRRVVRATFSAELLGLCDTVDRGILLVQMLHEIQTGGCTVSTARRLREHGGYSTALVAIVDAMSVFAACTASYIKIPADNAMLSHVQYIRELLDVRALKALGWADTRDMLADGATKGAVDREALHRCMSGWCQVEHEVRLWQAKGTMSGMEHAAAQFVHAFAARQLAASLCPAHP